MEAIGRHATIDGGVSLIIIANYMLILVLARYDEDSRGRRCIPVTCGIGL